MEETKTMKTPMSSSVKLATDEKGKSIDSTMYRGMIGGPIISTIRGVEIRLDPKNISHIFDIAPVGLRVLTVINRVLHHMICSIFLPWGGHRDEVRRVERPLAQARGQEQTHPGVEEEAEIREMEGGGPSSQSSFIEPSHIEIPPHQAPHAPDHAHWMDLSTQISSLGTLMEELAVVNDNRFYSMEDRMYQYQAGFTSPFERLEYRMDQHQADFTL
ncbi:hypothetical protein CK203_026014 [Vitis vinifera]|uniref:Uncharacterized protein n=1 Tax=Vitis vinifera TaxID=29760 RepID=A0A438IJG5_VITVI|nr:hypothetical protein CK203_026014 [Vitis vinifera]